MRHTKTARLRQPARSCLALATSVAGLFGLLAAGPGPAGDAVSDPAPACASQTCCAASTACSPGGAQLGRIAHDPARFADPVAGARTGALDAALETIRARHRVPALVVAATRSDRLIAAGAAGVRAAGESAVVTIDDRFHLGSCGKSITATLAARLVDAGVIDWESTVGATLEPAGIDAGRYGAVTLAPAPESSQRSHDLRTWRVRSVAAARDVRRRTRRAAPRRGRDVPRNGSGRSAGCGVRLHRRRLYDRWSDARACERRELRDPGRYPYRGPAGPRQPRVWRSGHGRRARSAPRPRAARRCARVPAAGAGRRSRRARDRSGKEPCTRRSSTGRATRLHICRRPSVRPHRCRMSIAAHCTQTSTRRATRSAGS